jgi:peptidoglycan/xylan/chitin deacetylase (PgdA/CDA1 family)
MSRRSTRMLKALLSALHYSGADRLLAPLTRGVGAIFTLHHVRADPPATFEPNRILRVTPQFLEQALFEIRRAEFDVVSLDEAHFRLLEGDFRPFVCLTFDDGYRDNLEVAYPIFKRHNLPFAVYVCTDFADGRGDLWWLALEKAICRVESLTVKMDGAERRWRCRSAAEKDAAFHGIYWWLRRIREDDARAVVAELCQATGFDPSRLCADLVMGWQEIRRLAADPLVTIGAHTRRHFALAKLTTPEARDEIAHSVARIERELGLPCRHLSYPYGDALSAAAREFQLARELGFRTGVTTRKGLLKRQHAAAPTALPRVSLNGDYQHPRYLKVFLTGAPFALASGTASSDPEMATVP